MPQNFHFGEKQSLLYLFTKGPQVNGERKGVAPHLLVALTLGEVKAEPQQGHGNEGRKLLQFGRLKPGQSNTVWTG